MEAWSPLKHVCHQTAYFCPLFNFHPLEKFKSYVSPLIDRVTSNWKVILMDCSTIIAISCCVITCLNSSPILCAAFAIVALASGIGAFYMRRFETLTDLEETVKKLRETKDRLEHVAQNLERENERLSQSIRELQRTNEAFRATNRDLQATNEAFRQTNTRLTQQVTLLTLQVTQLRESAEKIREEIVRFQQENSHLHHNVRGFDQSLRVLDQQIQASRSLCEQIGNHLASQQQGIGQQLEQLRGYLAELRADNRVHERIQELSALHQQTAQATSQLHALQIQYAQERANFEAIHRALVQLRNQFDASLRDAVSSLQVNNQQFRDNLSGLSAERNRIQQMIDRFFSGNTQPRGR